MTFLKRKKQEEEQAEQAQPPQPVSQPAPPPAQPEKVYVDKYEEYLMALLQQQAKTNELLEELLKIASE